MGTLVWSHLVSARQDPCQTDTVKKPKVTRLRPVRPYSATLRTGTLGLRPTTSPVIEFHQQKGHK